MKNLLIFLFFFGNICQNFAQNATIQDNTQSFILTPSGLRSTRINGSLNSIALGANAMTATIGSQHVAIGDGALNMNTTAWGSVAIGYNALNKNNFTGGVQNANTAIGHTALANNTTGYVNTAIGARALLSNISGYHNTAIGSLAGEFATGSRNIFIGVQAGQNEAGSDKLYIANTDTPNPLIWGDFSTNQLRINGKLQANGSADGYLQVTNPTSGLSSSDGLLLGFPNGSNLGQVINQEPNDLILGTNNAEKIRIKANGLVGVGLQDPQSDLHLHNSTTNTYLRLTNLSSSSSSTDGLRINIDNGTNHASLWNHENADLIFGTNDTQRMKISAAGNIETSASIGINVTPVSSLHIHQPSMIKSNALFTNSSSGTTNSDGLFVGLSDFITNGGYIWNNENEPLYFGTNGSNRMTIAETGRVGIGIAPNGTDKLLVAGSASIIGNMSVISGNLSVPQGSISCSGGTVCSSDFRFKKDFVKINSPLDNLLKINGLYYFWKKEDFKNKGFTDERQIGVIAQEVEKIFPELVKTDQEGYKAVDYARLTPILIEAIRELNQKIVRLENEKGDVKVRLDRIEALLLENTAKEKQIEPDSTLKK